MCDWISAVRGDTNPTISFLIVIGDSVPVVIAGTKLVAGGRITVVRSKLKPAKTLRIILGYAFTVDVHFGKMTLRVSVFLLCSKS